MLRFQPWKIVLVALICAAGVLFALPNLFGRDNAPSWLPGSQVNLGLDLQGGTGRGVSAHVSPGSTVPYGRVTRQPSKSGSGKQVPAQIQMLRIFCHDSRRLFFALLHTQALWS